MAAEQQGIPSVLPLGRGRRPPELAVSTSTVYGFRWSTGPFALILVLVVLARLDECQRPGARLAK